MKLVSGIETLQGAIGFKVRFIIRIEAFILQWRKTVNKTSDKVKMNFLAFTTGFKQELGR